jgi:glucosylceramidase
MTITHIYETTKESDSRLRLFSANERIQSDKRHLACTIQINPERVFQSVEGFGGALTESVGYVLSLISPEKRKEVLSACFSPETGNRYTFARTHMNSCDFSLENWACTERADGSLESFSMERTDAYITPIIREAQDCMGGSSLRVMVTPWSPPAWMKDNNDMNHGGKLLKEYCQLWASHYVRFIDELKKRGVSVWAVSVQNEPEANQTWDSCLWTAVEEGEFAVQHLGPTLEKYAGSGSRVKIFVLDHNRDILWDRFSETMSVPGADKYVDGAAFHWYSGDQYENVAKVSQNFPGKELFFTEGCIEGGPRPGAWFSGERYAHNLINDLNNGCTGWIDWNIALDMEGGPNHVGNNCDAPILVDTKSGEVHYNSSYYYIGHFSRFIKPGAKRVELSSSAYMTPATIDGRMGNTMEFCAFKNTDGTLAIVVMNRTEADMVYELRLPNAAGDAVVLKCPPRGIQTLIADAAQ